jgi:hypothetical protein
VNARTSLFIHDIYQHKRCLKAIGADFGKWPSGVGRRNFHAVLVPDRLKVGMVYQTPIASERHFDFDDVLMKRTVRYEPDQIRGSAEMKGQEISGDHGASGRSCIGQHFPF